LMVGSREIKSAREVSDQKIGVAEGPPGQGSRTTSSNRRTKSRKLIVIRVQIRAGKAMS
jgi:hypothetical protein